MKSPGEVPASPVDSKEPKISYPSLNFNDTTADDFLKECDCDLGEEITATVRLKVTSLRKDEYGNSVGFDVLSIDDIKDSDEGEEDAESKKDEEKVLGYKRPATKKEAPAMSAKDLE